MHTVNVYINISYISYIISDPWIILCIYICDILWYIMIITMYKHTNYDIIYEIVWWCNNYTLWRHLGIAIAVFPTVSDGQTCRPSFLIAGQGRSWCGMGSKLLGHGLQLWFHGLVTGDLSEPAGDLWTKNWSPGFPCWKKRDQNGDSPLSQGSILSVATQLTALDFSYHGFRAWPKWGQLNSYTSQRFSQKIEQHYEKKIRRDKIWCDVIWYEYVK